MDLMWTGFALGFLGSLHCIGMCGPIAVALPLSSKSRFHFTMGRALYNLGRTVTYTAMGAVSGLLGHTLQVGNYQQTVSIILGILILVAVLVPTRFVSRLLPFLRYDVAFDKIKHAWGKLFRQGSVPSLFAIGILNGFLPCGLVYMGLAGAVATGQPLMGAGYMALFGLGTIPVMFVVSMVGKMLGTNVRRKLSRLIPIGGTLLAALFILRGLSLGIPYVSPNMNMTESGQMTMECHDDSQAMDHSMHHPPPDSSAADSLNRSGH